MWRPRAPRLSTRRTRRGVLASTAVGFALAVVVTATCHALRPSGTRASVPADSASYVYSVQRTGFNASETGISPASAPSLQQLWTAKAPAVVSVQPVVVNGLVYWGAWDGVERATRLDGTLAWSASLGTTPPPSGCSGRTHGVLGSATVTTVTIGGVPQSVVYVAGGNDTFYALNATTGAIIWQNQLAASPNEIWDSPAVYNGSVYIALASWGDCPLTQARVFQLDAATGAILHTFNVVPNGCTGAGVWGSISIDPATGLLFFATGNGNTCSQSEPYGFAIVAVHAADLSYVSSWQVPSAQRVSDGDFGSAPTVFSATIGGTTHNLVGVANKNGIYYALDEANISAGPIWQDQIAGGGSAPESGTGSISPSAWDGTNLYVAGGGTTINSQSCKGGLRAVDPATGAFIWQVCLTDGFVLGPVAAVPGVVAVGDGNALALMATSDGHALFKAFDSTASHIFYGGPSIANGVVYIGNSDGTLFAFGTSSTTPIPSATPGTPTPTPAPGTILAQDTFQRPNQALWGTASDGHVWGGDANTLGAFSINNNAGQIANGSGPVNAVAGPAATDSEVLFTGALSAYGATNMGAVLRWQDTNNWYKAYIDGSTLVVQRKVAGTNLTLGSTPFAATAGTSYSLRFRIVGTSLSARVWPAGGVEPATWMVTATDASFAAGFAGFRVQTASGVTGIITSFLADVPSGTTTPTPTSTAVASITATATSAPSQTASATSTMAATSTASPTPTGVSSATATNTPLSTASSSATATATPTPVATVSPTPTPTVASGTVLAQDTFARPNQALWGTASDGHVWGGDANTLGVFAIAGGAGQIANTSGPANAVLGPSASDSEVLFTGALSTYATTNMGAVLRWQDTNNWYKAYIDGSTLVVQKRVGGAYTILGSVPFAANGGTPYSLRFQIVGSTLRARAWPAASSEPAAWMVTAADASIASGSTGLRVQATGVTATITSFIADVPAVTPSATATNTPLSTASSSATATATPTPVATATPTPTPTVASGTVLAQDTFARPNQALWGTASDGHVWGGDANTLGVFSIAGGAGQIANTSGPVNAVLGPSASDSEVLFTGALSAYTATNMGAVLRWRDANDWYKEYIDGSSLVVQKRVSGAYTILGSVPFAATGGTPYNLRFQIVGSTLRARVWPAVSSEPAAWMITAADTSIASGFAGLRVQATGVTATITSVIADVP